MLAFSRDENEPNIAINPLNNSSPNFESERDERLAFYGDSINS